MCCDFVIKLKFSKGDFATAAVAAISTRSRQVATDGALCVVFGALFISRYFAAPLFTSKVQAEKPDLLFNLNSDKTVLKFSSTYPKLKFKMSSGK